MFIYILYINTHIFIKKIYRKTKKLNRKGTPRRRRTAFTMVREEALPSERTLN